jgi:hypothetical protein
LVRGVQQRFGPTFTVMRRVEAIKSSKARSGAPDRSSAGGESELDQAVSRDPESWDPQEQQDHLAREVYDVLFQLNLEQELQPIVEAIGKEACFPGVLTQEALDAYHDELLDRTVFLGESADADEAAPLRAALEPVYRRASPGERKLLQRAADEGVLKPILQQLIREQIRKRHAAKQR